MKAARVLRFGPPSLIQIDDVPRPSPGRGQLLVRVEQAQAAHEMLAGAPHKRGKIVLRLTAA